MSHQATAWAIRQRGLKPAVKILLWHLADHHNPSFGCFPSQKRLAAECEISERTVGTHLRTLEDLGLIRRVKSRASGEFFRTEYELNFEYIHTPPEKIADGEKHASPPENLRTHHRKKLPTNLVRGTSNITHANACATFVAQNENFWSDSLQILLGSGVTERRARSIIGKWLSEGASQALVIDALQKSKAAADPASHAAAIILEKRPARDSEIPEGAKKTLGIMKGLANGEQTSWD